MHPPTPGPYRIATETGVLARARAALGAFYIQVVTARRERGRVQQIGGELRIHPGKFPLAVLQRVGQDVACVRSVADDACGVDGCAGLVGHQSDIDRGLVAQVIRQIESEFLAAQRCRGHFLRHRHIGSVNGQLIAVQGRVGIQGPTFGQRFIHPQGQFTLRADTQIGLDFQPLWRQPGPAIAHTKRKLVGATAFAEKSQAGFEKVGAIGLFIDIHHQLVCVAVYGFKLVVQAFKIAAGIQIIELFPDLGCAIRIAHQRLQTPFDEGSRHVACSCGSNLGDGDGAFGEVRCRCGHVVRLACGALGQ